MVIPGAVSLLQSTLSASPTSISPGASSTLVLTTRDLNGNRLTSGGLPISFSVSGGAAVGTLGAVQDLSDGTYRAIYTGVSAGTDLIVSASIAGSPLLSTLPTLSVTGRSIEVPIEMLDVNLAPDADDPSTTFDISRTNLDTTDYDGNPTYSFEIVASNTVDSSAYVKLLDSMGNEKATILVGTNTSPTRYRVPFTPNAGADQYRLFVGGWSVPNHHHCHHFSTHNDDRDSRYDDEYHYHHHRDSNDLTTIFAARIIVKQTNATKSKIYFPLLASEADDLSEWNSSPDGLLANFVDVSRKNYRGSYHQGRSDLFGLWLKNPSTYSGISPSGTPWTYDAILWGDKSNTVCKTGLFNKTTGSSSPVNGSELSTTSNSPVLLSASFSNSAGGFIDNNLFESRIKSTTDTGHHCMIAKAGLWLKLDNLSRGEVFYRTGKPMSHAKYSNVNSTNRILLDATLFGDPDVDIFQETSGYITPSLSSSSDATLFLATTGTSDIGISGASELTGCSISSADLGFSRTRVRSAACTGWTNGDRIVLKTIISGGVLSTSSIFTVVKFY
jgi:hypothetical protein